eukprot:gb/GEZN01001142.1/.p1 GENE.gb/GEZN01001142.1/~~gb/GEZN01001142.1/.p1  ORF type:complete len:1082 (-),score=33.46 gb/GEZN01001142.1/:36-3245(-)
MKFCFWLLLFVIILLLCSADNEAVPRFVVVTGAAGYIGSHVSIHLLELGYTVAGIDNLSRGSIKALSVLRTFPHFEFIDLDLGVKQAVNDFFRNRRIDIVFHFAAVAFPRESFVFPGLYEQNISKNTEILVNAMVQHRVPLLVYSSTCAVYGSAKQLPINENSQMAPISPYGQAKLHAEEFIRSMVSPTFKAHMLRYFNVIGADRKGRLGENPRPDLAEFGRLWTTCVDTAFNQRPCVPIYDSELDTPDGTSVRDYVDVEDLVLAHVAVLKAKTTENVAVWNIATGKASSTLHFVRTAQSVMRRSLPICFADMKKFSGPPKLYGSAARLYQATGWTPKITQLNQSLAAAWAWALKQRQENDEHIPTVTGIFSKRYDVCIVGAGLSGAVLAERHVAVFNHSVLVIEKRDHIGGNIYDYVDEETGIRVSKYGVHLFHTNYDRVWNYMQKFSRWSCWEHRCLAKLGQYYVPVPVNIDTVNILFNLSILSSEEMQEWLNTVKVPPPGGIASNSEEVALDRVGRRLYELIFKPYTIKQWNKDPKMLSPSVLARIPVRHNHDDRYFSDLYQALPTGGYTRIVENMLNPSKIKILINTDFFDVRNFLQCNHTYFTGPIDAYFVAQGLPKLEYRSLQFDRRVFRNTDFYQPKAHVNYPDSSYNYTRGIEYKHLLHQLSPHTIVFFEYSSDVGEPFYPVPNSLNQALYAKYQQLAMKVPNVTFVGRLANYKYFNMDQTVLNALQLFDRRFLMPLGNSRTEETEASTCQSPVNLSMFSRAALQHRFGNCSHIWVRVAIYKSSSQKGVRPIFKEDLSLVPPIIPDCSVIIMTKNPPLEELAHSSGWQIVELDVIALGVDSSNEAQRLAHLLKTSAPLLFPWASRITYGDMKCPWFTSLQQHENFTRSLSASSIVLLMSPHHYTRPLDLEFASTINHMKDRKEGDDVIRDIERQKERFGAQILRASVLMADCMCILYNVKDSTRAEIRALSCDWSYEVQQFSMREQLSLNVALARSSLMGAYGRRYTRGSLCEDVFGEISFIGTAVDCKKYDEKLSNAVASSSKAGISSLLIHSNVNKCGQ